jgi:hypothetical protein
MHATPSNQDAELNKPSGATGATPIISEGAATPMKANPRPRNLSLLEWYCKHHSAIATAATLLYTALTFFLVIGAFRQLTLLVNQQQNAVVLQLWQNWDSTLDIGDTRSDVSRFNEWQKSAMADEVNRRKWIEVLVAGDATENTDDKGNVLGAPEDFAEAFAKNPGTLTRDDIERVRGSITRFLNMLEQGCIAYEYEFGNKEVMERAMKPQHLVYADSFRDYIKARQAGVPGAEAQPQAWMPILEFLDNSKPERKSKKNVKTIPSTRTSGSANDRLDRLYDYTKWHLGVYVSCIGFLSAVAAGAAQSGPSGMRWLAALAGSPRLLLVSIVLVAFAAASGGIVATTCIQCDNINDFAGSSFIFPSKWWTYIEHGCFWFACAAFGWSIYSSDAIVEWLSAAHRRRRSDGD